MKALSLYEPWASLVALRKKGFETRSWRTDYRGDLLICASKRRPPTAQILAIMYRGGLTFDDLYPDPGTRIKFQDDTKYEVQEDGSLRRIKE